MRPEPQDVLPLQAEGSPPAGEEAVLVMPEGQCPAPAKKAVIRARQGGAFKPPALARQGSSSTETGISLLHAGCPKETVLSFPPMAVGNPRCFHCTLWVSQRNTSHYLSH
ncbi:hypothetical protein V5799_029217 [Amblyomma americanum]|uniref:Uncharacterized protein n=1 Tax=Amblyomma americanum TaxID=6943 RepID=A0AAQ4ERZ3_AMBAM